MAGSQTFEKAIGNQSEPPCWACWIQVSISETLSFWSTLPRVRTTYGFWGGIDSAFGCPAPPSPVSPRPEV